MSLCTDDSTMSGCPCGFSMRVSNRRDVEIRVAVEWTAPSSSFVE